MSLFHCWGRTKVSVQVQVFLCEWSVTWYVFMRPTPKLEDHPLWAVCTCLFNIFTSNLYIGGRSSIWNLMKHHAVVTGTHLPITDTFNYCLIFQTIQYLYETWR
jgi:hypothetical protein